MRTFANVNYPESDNEDFNVRKDVSNKVVFIQGHKEAKLLNKDSNISESDKVRSGVVLYEAPENEDDVELVMADDTKFGFADSSNEMNSDYYQVNEVAQNHEVPNVNQKTLDRLKEEEKKEKQIVENKGNKDKKKTD